MTLPINIEPIRQRDNLLDDPSPGTAAHDRRLLLAHFDALVDAARDVAHRGPKCDCETCEDAFDRLRDMLPYEYTNASRENV